MGSKVVDKIMSKYEELKDLYAQAEKPWKLREQVLENIKVIFSKEVDPLIEQLTPEEREELRCRIEKEKGLKQIEVMKDSSSEGNLNVLWDEEVNRLYWNKKEILKDLKTRIDINREAEELWHKWKRVTIKFPAVRGSKEHEFSGYEFSYFESYDIVRGLISFKEFERAVLYSKYKEALHSKEECCELLEKMNRYMEALWVSMDEGVDFKSGFNFKEIDAKSRSDTGDCLKEVMWLNRLYWIWDKDWKKDWENKRLRWKDCLYAIWNCDENDCDFRNFTTYLGDAYLFLR